MKCCAKCLLDKPIDEFHRQKNAPDGRRYACKACVKLYYSSTRYQTPSRVRQYNLQRRFGLTVADYEARLASQEGGCAICGSDRGGATRWSFCVDHDHATGDVRGLLCTACNAVIGYARDNPSLLRDAADYLEMEPQDIRGPAE